MRLLLVASTAAVLEANLDHIRIDETGSFVDHHNRTRIFHGVNVAYKRFPWHPVADAFNPYDSLVEEDMENLQRWGFNVVRLAVFWSGVESALGVVNATYVQEISRIVNDLAKHGVHTLASLHQDLLSRRFCGEGVPEFYVDNLLADNRSALFKAQSFPQPLARSLRLDETGNPDLKACLEEPLFADFYGSEQVGALFNELYTEGTSLHEGYLRYWEVIAKNFGGTPDKAPHVLGYELLNEPSGYCLTPDAPTCGKRPGLIFNNKVEQKQLTPLYRAAQARIRAADPVRPIFYQPRAFPLVSPTDMFAATNPFESLPLGNDTQQGFAYHIYCQPHMGGLLNDMICRMLQQLAYEEYLDFVKLFQRKGLGSFMSEFGAIGETDAEYWEIDRLLAVADDSLQSWAYWQLKQYHDLTTANGAESLYDKQGKLEPRKVKLLSRTYAQAIGGRPLRMSFTTWPEWDAGTFTLAYKALVTTAPTEIYLNEEIYYPQGYDVDIKPAECILPVRQRNRLHLHLRDVNTTLLPIRCVGSIVYVHIVPKKAGAPAKKFDELGLALAGGSKNSFWQAAVTPRIAVVALFSFVAFFVFRRTPATSTYREVDASESFEVDIDTTDSAAITLTERVLPDEGDHHALL